LSNNNRKHCPECGAETIVACPKCNAPIPGGEFTLILGLLGKQELIDVRNPGVPRFCDTCGTPFPWESARELFKMAEHESPEDLLEFIENLLRRFPLMITPLGKRYANRPPIAEIKDEHDVQDLIHSVLHLFFDNIKPEEYTPSYGGGSSKMDFLLGDHSIAIEAKKTRDTLGNNEITTQLNDDIARYKNSCKTLFCFVYDPEHRIKNPVGMEKDLSGNHDGLDVKVIVTPKGL
jgi:hypothetical protein